MNRTGTDFFRLRRRIRLVCLVLVPIIACTMSALSLWGQVRAGRPFEPHPIFSGLGLIGWGLSVFVLSGPVLAWAERGRDRRAQKKARRP